MAKRPEFVAWLVIWTSFALLCLTVAAIVIGILWYRQVAFDSRDARLNILSGTVLIRGKSLPTWVSADQNMVLVEGDSVRTDQTSQALLTLFDNSTVLLFSGSELQIVKIASAKFEPLRESVVIHQVRGKAHIGVAIPTGSEKHFEITTPQSSMLLKEGSFSVTVNDKSSQLRVQERGAAIVSSTSDTIELQANQRVEVLEGGIMGSQQAAKEELIFNGDFSQGLAGWRAGNELGFPEGQDVEGEAVPVLEDGHTAVRFSRHGSKGTHCETYVYKEIDRDVSDLSTLRLSLKLKLIYQSLSGGGYMGSEYPLIVRIDYKSAGAETFHVYGFYYQNEARNRTDNGVLLPQNVWQQYTVPENLMTLVPRPRQIISVQVIASGWDYESVLGNISLQGE
ncbi:MAG: FecR family protein [Chloroflexota bacterium]